MYLGLIFTYGVTSSGKTHTITGRPSNCGILPRTLDVIFNTIDKNDLQSIKYVFRPDSQNSFDILSTPDALLQQQNEHNPYPTTPYKQNTNGLSARTPRSVKKNDIKSELIEWENRVKEIAFVNKINCDNNYAVFISYVEIYNNYIYDLLDDSFDQIRANGIRQPRSKNLREDNKKHIYVNGVSEVEVKNANEAFELFIKGINRRRIATTSLNHESSRSHSVFTIRLVQAPLDLNGTELLENKNYIHVSQLSIVDLAGCERASRTQATGNRLKEASNINNSLMSLRSCFDILRENQKFNTNKVVPYRDNKLTHLFKSFFEGDGKVKMVICVSPDLEDYEETLQVAKFAEVSQEITTIRSLAFTYQNRRKSDINLAPIDCQGPSFPSRFLEDPEDSFILPEWIQCLEQQQKTREANIALSLENQMTIRHCIAQLQQDHMLLQQQNSVTLMDLEARESQLKEFENRFSQMERTQESMKRRIQELESENRSLTSQVKQKDDALNKLKLENTKLVNGVSEQMSNEKNRLKKCFFMMLQQKESELQRQKCINQDKMNLVKQILSTEEEDLFANFVLSPKKKSVTIDHQQTVPKTPEEKRSQVSSNTEPKACLSRVEGPPVVNPRHRRSLSTGTEKWIDHRPMGTLDMGTVLIPHIKNRKSVTNLKASDFLNKNAASKYALTHHEANEGGKVETKVFKGEVIPSSSGGAQIIFSDVETLKQSSPGNQQPRKRLVQAVVSEINSRQAGTGVSGPGTPSSSSNVTTASSTPTTNLPESNENINIMHNFLTKYV